MSCLTLLWPFCYAGCIGSSVWILCLFWFASFVGLLLVVYLVWVATCACVDLLFNLLLERVSGGCFGVVLCVLLWCGLFTVVWRSVVILCLV